jgi:hypothetical protein
MRRYQSAIEEERSNRVVLVVAPETCSNVTCHLCNIPVVQSWLDPIVAMGWDQLFSILQ